MNTLFWVSFTLISHPSCVNPNEAPGPGQVVHTLTGRNMSRDLFYDSEGEVFPMIEKIQGFLPLVLAPSGLLKRGNLHTYQQQASVQCICVEYIIMAFGRPTNNNFSFTPLQIPRGIQNSENTHFEIHKTLSNRPFYNFQL